MLDAVSIGKKINKLRLDYNMSQEELADTLLVSRQSISKGELGISLPTVDNLVTLINIFDGH